MIYPLVFLSLFSITVLKEDLDSKKRNELIVYNTPGSSTIGIKIGKVINLICDTTIIRPEVIRHAATLGLRIDQNTFDNSFRCFETGKEKILITRFLNNKIIEHYKPEIIILAGRKPVIENSLNLLPGLKALIITSEPSTGFRFPRNTDLSGIDSIHFVRRSGAFIERL